MLTFQRESESSGDSDGGNEEVEEDIMDVESDEDDDEEEQQPNRPYRALLQSFQEASAPSAKRRKLGHDVEATAVDNEDEDEEEGGEAQDGASVDEEEEEEEEEEEILEAGDNDDDSEDEEGSSDPFDVHFAHPDELSTAKAVNAAKIEEWTTGRKLMGPLRATLQSSGSDSVFSTHDLKSVKLKPKLQDASAKTLSSLNEAQKHVASLLFSYQDVLYCDRNVDNAETLRRLVCCHALNHVFK